jgi:ABC-type multidrug transport system ATPase subunit
MSLLEGRQLVVRRGRADVLHGVDLELRAGEVVALLGPNGAGKSTLLHALCGLIPVASGTVSRNGRVALVMQDAGLAQRSVRANILLALGWWRVPRTLRRELADHALAMLGVAHLADRSVRTLSGGERRRVHLARGLAVQPDVLLLDEPFAGLDPESHALLRDDIAATLRAEDRTVLVVLHDREDAWALADKVVVMIAGRIAAQGTPQALLAEPGSRDVARLLGYDGELRVGDRAILTRAADVRIDWDGGWRGTVRRVIPTQDGARVQVQLPEGNVWAITAHAETVVGETVGVRLLRPVEFDLDSARTTG